MGELIKAELQKMLFKKGVLMAWILSLLLGLVLITNGTVAEVYADAFYKSYGYTPVIGLIMFMVLSGSYTMEYESNMRDLINTTKNGKKRLVVAKTIGAGIGVSIINISILMIIYLDAMRKANFKGLNMPLKNLWYFKGIDSNLSVLQMMIIVLISVIVISFFFASLTLYLSSISKTATIPFIVGGFIMGFPYILDGFMPAKIFIFTPLWGMIPSQIIKHKGGFLVFLIQGIILAIGLSIFPRLTFNVFTKEHIR